MQYTSRCNYCHSYYDFLSLPACRQAGEEVPRLWDDRGNLILKFITCLPAGRNCFVEFIRLRRARKNKWKLSSQFPVFFKLCYSLFVDSDLIRIFESVEFRLAKPSERSGK